LENEKRLTNGARARIFDFVGERGTLGRGADSTRNITRAERFAFFLFLFHDSFRSGLTYFDRSNVEFTNLMAEEEEKKSEEKRWHMKSKDQKKQERKRVSEPDVRGHNRTGR
jgi:hypothetical protein